LHGLDEMEASIALQLEDAKGQTQPNSDWGRTTRRGSGEIIARKLAAFEAVAKKTR
jgi:hypothetical protein